MTISFSGPSSGIDTTAWVDALVKMKQASITSMETKKQVLVETTSILDNVKSFFASFKSVLTNITQANMGIPAFDLFIQNLAETTNADVATASVTTEAQQNNYELFVDQIATETQANSVFFTNIISTTQNIATHDSLLSSIGVGTGRVGFKIGIDNDGGDIIREITIQSNDTIGTFIDKLNRIGIDASYDAQLGLFSINVDKDDIVDYDNTGIYDALGLQDVNSGYSSDTLELSSFEDFIIKATENAKMSAFGITNGEFIVKDSNGTVTPLCANVDGTFREFFDILEGYGLYASFDEEGVIHIETTQGYLLSGTLAQQLGIVIDDQSEITDTKASSTLGVFSTETISAEYTSTLGEIGAIVNNSDTLLVLDIHNSSTPIATINNLTKDSTVDDLFSELAKYGISGTLNNNVISFESPTGNIIGGKIAENLGIDTYQTSTTTIKTGESTTSTTMISYVASATDWISDCLWDVWDSYSEADKTLTITHTDRYGTDQTYHYRVVAKNEIAADGSVQVGTKFEDIVNWYKSIDPTSTFVFDDDGHIFIDSNDCFYLEGKIAEYLGIGGHTDTYTWTHGASTTTSSSDTISYRVRKTDYISDTLWDNGWLNYSDGDKVISAYSITVDHTTANQSTINPNYTTVNGVATNGEYTANGNAEGNYTETDETYQHTVQTLIGTFTIKQGQTTYEDLGYWFTHVIDQTAAFTINNDGTISIDSDNNIHLEGKAITDLGLGISTIGQSWTTGLEETVSTGSVTYAAKMTDYIADTFTDAQWANVNKKLSVYSNTIDHYDGADGNGVYQVTIQTKLTDIIINENTTFNDLRDALQPYNIVLDMQDGVITFDSTASNYLVEETFQDISLQNGVTVLQQRTTSHDGTTSMLDYFGIISNTVHQSWTTGTASTESTGVAINDKVDDPNHTINPTLGVEGVVKGTDYLSDTFTAGQWASLTGYTDSAGNYHQNGHDIVVMHSYLNHDTQQTVIECKTTITITETTKFGNMNIAAENDSAHSTIIVNGVTVAGKTLADVLNELGTNSAWGSGDPRDSIKMSIEDGVIQLDSNCLWIEGSIPVHYGMKVDSVSQTWTTGTATTQSTGVIKYNVSMTDYISDTFTANEWASLASYTDTAGNTNGGNTIAIMHAELNHSTHQTVISRATTLNIDTNWTFNDLASELANYGITLSIENGIIKLNSDPASNQNNSNYYIEGSIVNHWGAKYDSITQSWTTGSSSTQSGGAVNYNAKMTDYISDAMTSSKWNSINKNIVVHHTELNHSNHQTVISELTTITVTNTMKFQDLANQLSPYGISLWIENGAVKMDSASSGISSGTNYITGAIPDFYGVSVDTITQNWTTGAEMTKSSGRVSYNADMDDLIKNMYTDSEWASTNKVITFTGQTYDTDDHVAKDTVVRTVTVQDSWTLNDLNNAILALGEGKNINVSNGDVYVFSWMRIEGDIANKLGITYQTETQTWTIGNTVTSDSAVTYNSDNDDRVRDLYTANEWSGVNKTLTIKDMGYDFNSHSTYTNNVGTINVTDDMTISGLNSALSAYGISLSVSNGVVTLNSNRQGCWVEGAIADRMGLSYNTQTLTHTIGSSVTSSSGISYGASWDDTLYEYLHESWNSLDKSYTIRQSTVGYYTDGEVHEHEIAVLSVSDTTTFNDLKNTLANYYIEMSLSGGTISFSGYNNYYVTGDIPSAIGATTGTHTATLTYAQSATSSEALKFTGFTDDDYVSDIVGWENLTDKNMYIVSQSYVPITGEVKHKTISADTTNMKISELKSWVLNKLITISADGTTMDLSTYTNVYHSFYLEGQVADLLGFSVVNSQVATVEVGKTITGSQLTATATLDSTVADFGFYEEYQVMKYNAMTGTSSSYYDDTYIRSSWNANTNWTFRDLIEHVEYASGGKDGDAKVTGSLVNGVLSFTGRDGCYIKVLQSGIFSTGGDMNSTTTNIIDSTVWETGKITYQATVTTTTTSTSTNTVYTGQTAAGNYVIFSDAYLIADSRWWDITHTFKYKKVSTGQTYTVSITGSQYLEGIEWMSETYKTIKTATGFTIKAHKTGNDMVGRAAGYIEGTLADGYQMISVTSNISNDPYVNKTASNYYSVTTNTTTTTSTSTSTITKDLDDWAWNNVEVSDLSGHISNGMRFEKYSDNGTGGISTSSSITGINGNMTLAEQVSSLANGNYHINISRNGSKVRLSTSGSGNGNYYLANGMNTSFTKVSETTVAKSVYSSSGRTSSAITKVADGNTKMKELGITSGTTNFIILTMVDETHNDGAGGQTKYIDISSGNETLGTFLQKINNNTGNCMSASIVDGRIIITPQNSVQSSWEQCHWHIYTISSAYTDIANKLGLSVDRSDYITTQTWQRKESVGTNKSLEMYVSSNNIDRVTLGMMGYSNQTFVKSTHDNRTNPDSVSSYSISWSSNESLSTFLQRLRDNGFSADLDSSTHKVTVSSNTPYSYYLGFVGVNNPLKLSSTITNKTVTFNHAAGSKYINCGMGGTATAGDIAGGNISFEVTRLYDGQYSQDVSTPNGDYWGNVASNITLTWGSNESLADFVSRINNSDDARTYGYSISYNASNGTFTFNGSDRAWINNGSGTAARNTLNLTGSAYSTRNYNIVTEADSSKTDLKTYINNNTRLSDLGINSAQALNFFFHANPTFANPVNIRDGNGYHNPEDDSGRTYHYNYNWDTNETLGDFMNELNSSFIGQNHTYGYNNSSHTSFYINGNGQFVITGENGAYIEGIGSSMKSALKLNSAYTSTQTYSLKCFAYSDKTDLQTYINGNTRLGDMGLGNQSVTIVHHINNTYVQDGTSSYTVNTQMTTSVTYSPDGTSHTVTTQASTSVKDISQDPAQATETITVSWTTGESLSTFMNRLANYGITANVNTADRTFEFTGNENYYVQDISQGLADYFKVNDQRKQVYINQNGNMVDKNGNVTTDVNKAVKTYGKSYSYTLNYRNNADAVAETTFFNERNTRLNNMGISSSQSMTFVVHTNNTYSQGFTDTITNLVNGTDHVADDGTFTTSYNTQVVTSTRASETFNNVKFTVNIDGTNVEYTAKVNDVSAEVTVNWDYNSNIDNSETLQHFQNKINSVLAALYNKVGAENNVNGSYNMSFGVDANTGKWTFTGNEYTYVKDVSTDLANFTKVNNQRKENGTYGTSYNYTINYRADADRNQEYTYLNERNTKLRNMSIATNQTMDIVLHINNTFAVNQTDAEGNTVRVTNSNGDIVNGDSMSEIYNVTRTITVTWTTDQTLGQFETAVRNILHSEVDQDGNHMYDMTFSVDPNTGKWSFTGNEHTYVNRIDSGLESKMMLTGNSVYNYKTDQWESREGNTYGKSYDYTINYRADADNIRDYTYVNERNTKLTNLKRYDANGNLTQVTKDQVMEIVVHTNNTFAQDQTDGLSSIDHVTRTITVTWTSDKTLAEFENKINEDLENLYNEYGTTTNADGTYHITFNVDAESGKWSFTGTEYCYVRGFGDVGDSRDVTDYTSQLETYMNLTGEQKDTDPDTTGGTYGSSYDYDVIYRANADNNEGGTNPGAIDFTYLNERNTTLNNLSYVNGSGQTISTTQSQTLDIVIHINNTYAQDNTKSDIQQKGLSSGSTYYVTTTSAQTQTSASAINYYTTIVAGTSSTFAELGIDTSNPVEVFDGSQNKLGEITMQSTSTLQELFTAINNINSKANVTINDNGEISLNDGYITGNIATALGLNMIYYGDKVVAKTQTSAAAITYDSIGTMSASTTLADLGFYTEDATEVFDKFGTKLGQFILSPTASIGTFMASINALSTQGNATISNGIISIAEGYISGTLAEQFGMTRTDAGKGSHTAALATSSSEALYYNTTVNATGSTTFAELGIDTTNNIKLYDKYGHFVKDIEVDQNYSLDNLVSLINYATDPYNASITNNTITIKNGYIEGNIAEDLHINKITGAKESITINTTLTSTATVTVKSSGAVATGSNTMQDLGQNANTLSLKINGANFSIKKTDSIDTVVQKLTEAGLYCRFENGLFTVGSGTNQNGETVNITEMSNSLYQTFFHLKENHTGSKVKVDTYSSNMQNIAITDEHYINEKEGVTFEEVGCTGSGYFEVYDSNKKTTKRYNVAKTDGIESKFNMAGFDVTVDNNGIVTITSRDSNLYIKSASSAISNGLKMNFGENYTYGYVEFDTYGSTSSIQKQSITTKTINANTTLGDFGLTSCSITLGNNQTINISSGDKLMSKLNTLNSKGFRVTLDENSGKITIESVNGAYIKDMSPELIQLLNINVGEGYTYQTEHPYGSSNSNALKASVYSSISEDTTMANLGLTSATITTNNGTVTLNSNDKIMAKIREAGLGVSEVNGKLSISGDESKYLMSMSNNLKNALAINVGENYTWNRYVDEIINDGDIGAVTRTITVTWTYGALGTEDEDAKPETLGQFISDINASLAQATTTYKSMFNLSEDFTVSAYVDGEGKFHFTGDEYTYVSRIDDFLANALKVKSVTKEGETYGKSYNYTVQYANNSNNVTQYTYTNYDNMRLQNFDVYQDQYITIVTHNNTTFVTDATDDRIIKNSTITHENTTSTYVITWTAGSTGHTKVGNGYNNANNAITDGETFEELKYELEHFGIINGLATEASAVLGNGIYGINVTINDDKTISLVGNEYTYILGISDDLQNSFKIQNRSGEGYYYDKYDYSINFNNDGYTKQNTTLLNYDTRLDNLSIMADMTMTIETPEGGKSLIFDHDTTMQEIKERLFSDYGIEVTIEDKTGRITFTPTLIDEGYYILGMDTELKNGLKLITGEKGTYTLDSEQIIATNTAGVYTTTTYKNVTTTGGTYATTFEDNFDNTASRNLRFEDDKNIIKMSTRISRLNGYENGNGNITVHYADGFEQNISIRESMTMGQLCEILKDYGVTAEILAGGRVTFKSDDGTYIKSAEGGSNLLDVLNMSNVSIKSEGSTIITSKTLECTEQRESKYFATEETLLSTYSDGLLQANGVITFLLNDKYKSVTITSDDTFGTLIDKFKEKGLNAKIEAGKFSLSSGFDTFSIVDAATTANLSAIINFTEKINLGGYAMTKRSTAITSTTTINDTKTLSVVNFADESTTLGTFNIIGGTLSLYADGKKAGITISSSFTIADLQREFRKALGQNVNGSDEENITVKYEDGYIKIAQKDTNLIVGSNEDTSNFSAITGIFSNNGVAESTRQFYKANENTKVTEAGIFRNGTVTTGDFVVGDATISIDEDTTIGELVSQINTNPDSNVTAYWDNIDGEFIIKSNNTGNFYINFESGSSNFTDILGFTKTYQDIESGNSVTSINTDVQRQGKNARVRINGASYTSVSNTMGSDVTSIKGLTINLKGMSAGEATIISVKKDVQSLALAVSDVVDAYNALIDNINTALSTKSELHNDSELKRLRNQIKTIMTGTNKNSSIYRNILSIGVVTNTADPTNLTVGSGIYKLALDYEKFAKAFEADSDSVRTLLIGRVDSDGNVLEEGILTKLEALIDEAVESAGGYFERTEESFDRQIIRLDNKIAKGNDAIEKYRERLEKKYMSMNILNSNIQTQYQVYFK